jgi:hypothetical protein
MVAADYVLQNMNLVEKIKIITLFNLMNVQQKHGKLVNLKKLFLFRTTKEKEIQLSFLKMRNSNVK